MPRPHHLLGNKDKAALKEPTRSQGAEGPHCLGRLQGGRAITGRAQEAGAAWVPHGELSDPDNVLLKTFFSCQILLVQTWKLSVWRTSTRAVSSPSQNAAPHVPHLGQARNKGQVVRDSAPVPADPRPGKATGNKSTTPPPCNTGILGKMKPSLQARASSLGRLLQSYIRKSQGYPSIYFCIEFHNQLKRVYKTYVRHSLTDKPAERSHVPARGRFLLPLITSPMNK